MALSAVPGAPLLVPLVTLVSVMVTMLPLLGFSPLSAPAPGVRVMVRLVGLVSMGPLLLQEM